MGGDLEISDTGFDVLSSRKLSVLLTTEGTYPFHQGGVSTWCDMMVNRLGMVDFTVLAILTDPFITQKYTLPSSTKLIRIPLWGTDEPSEHFDVPFSSTYMAKKRTTISVIQERFIPVFDDFIREILSKEKDTNKMGRIIVQLYDFFRQFDYKVAFKSKLTWERYKVLVQEEVEKSTSGFANPDLYGMIQSLGWIYRFFNVVNTNVPETTIVHSTAAGFCGLPCVIAKLKYGTPFLLTEHGVYLREQYLSLSKRGYSSFLNTFLIRMIWTVTHLNYDLADQISPVCEYNTRWEKRITDRNERIRVIYNGVDHHVYTRVQPRVRERPTVVTVARIDPIKDLYTLIRTADEVRKTIPNVLFLIYGSITVQEYYEDCIELIQKLALESTVKLVGHTSNMVSAYDSADLVLQTSISEAFPYSVIEAMLSGKPVVATAVGGVAEAVGKTGILVNPGDVNGLTSAIQHLFENDSERLELGEESRRRALDLFTIDRSLQNYMRSYIRLTVIGRGKTSRRRGVTSRRSAQMLQDFAHPNNGKSQSSTSSNQKRLAMERSLAMLTAGFPVAAAEQLKSSVRKVDSRPADVVKLMMLTSIYEKLGFLDEITWARQATAELAEIAAGNWQRLLAEKAYAFADNSLNDKAVRHFRGAVLAKENSPAVPSFRLELSRIFMQQGDSLAAEEYLAKLLQI